MEVPRIAFVAVVATALVVPFQGSAQYNEPRLLEMSDLVLEVGGASDGSEPFSRVAGLAVDDSLRMFIADLHSNEVRAYSADGQHLWTQGKSGAGPNEYRLITWIGTCWGDSVVVMDGRLLRLTIYDSAGNFMGDAPVPSRRGQRRSPSLAACVAAGLVLGGWPRLRLGAKPGPYRSEIDIDLFSRTGHFVEALAHIPGGERYLSESGTMTYPRRLGAFTFLVGQSEALYLGDGARTWIHTWNGHGWHRIDLPISARPIPDAHIQAYIDRALQQRHRPDAQGYRRHLEQLEWPDRYPVFSDMVADRQGNVWVQQYPPVGYTESRWLRVNVEHEMVTGHMLVPRQFRIEAIVGGRAVGIWTDELTGEQRVRAYAISDSLGG